MAAEIEETHPITGCKHEFAPSDAEHIILDQHEILRRLGAFERLAEDLAPLIERYKRTGGGVIGVGRGVFPGRRSNGG